MPTARSGGASGFDGRRIYVAGGEVTTKDLVGALRSVEAYEPATNSWTTLPSMPRHGIVGAVIGNRGQTLSAPRELATASRGADHPTLVVTRRGLRVSWFSADTGHRLLPVEEAGPTAGGL